MSMFNESQLVCLNGARQYGKSTLALQIAKALNKEYITFGDTIMFTAANSDPNSFIRGIDTNLVLDEIQMLPGMFRNLKQHNILMSLEHYKKAQNFVNRVSKYYGATKAV